VKDDPWRYLRVSVSRAKEFFKFWPTTDSGRASNFVRMLSFGLFLPFLVAGVVLTMLRPLPESAPGRSSALLLLSVAALYSLIHLLTWTLVRYRLPLDAVTMPFVGVSIVALFSRLRARASSPEAHVSASAS
jgi:hypothetical protein